MGSAANSHAIKPIIHAASVHAVNTLDLHPLCTPHPMTGVNPTTEKNPLFVTTSQSLSCHYTAKT